MKWRQKSIVLIAIMTIMAMFVVGCGTQEETSPQGEQKAAEPCELVISAAASLTDAMSEIGKLYEEENENVKLTFNFGSSGSLQQQIEQGAPADVFMSAASKQMNALDEKDLIIKETRKDLLKNSLALVVAKDAEEIKSFEDLEKAKIIALGEPESVPVGKYSQELLSNMGLWEKVQGQAVYAKDVRQVLAYVESGDAEVGIVYHTDAKISDKVKVVAIGDENMHSPVVYPVALVKSTQNEEAAQSFVDFLSTDKATKIFEKYGFTVGN